MIGFCSRSTDRNTVLLSQMRELSIDQWLSSKTQLILYSVRTLVGALASFRFCKARLGIEWWGESEGPWYAKRTTNVMTDGEELEGRTKTRKFPGFQPSSRKTCSSVPSVWIESKITNVVNVCRKCSASKGLQAGKVTRWWKIIVECSPWGARNRKQLSSSSFRYIIGSTTRSIVDKYMLGLATQNGHHFFWNTETWTRLIFSLVKDIC